jgi:hypothetical protein
MRIEVHQRGGVLGLDRRVLVSDGTIEVIDRGRSRGARPLDRAEAERLDALAQSAADARPGERDPSPPTPVSDAMHVEIAIGERRITVRTGDGSPAELLDLLAELGRAAGAQS